MRVAVTGASGNVGSAIVPALLAAGHHVVGVCRRPPQDSRVSWVTADLAQDSARRLDTAFTGADAVVHLAWAIQPGWRPDYTSRVAVGGTRQVLDAVARCGVTTLTHMSSVAAYSPAPRSTRVEEDAPAQGVPSLAYSRDKVAVERMLGQFAADEPAVAVSWLRSALVFQRGAAGGISRYFVPYLANLLRRLPVLCAPSAVAAQVVHADDVASALLACVEQGARGPFNVAADPPLLAPDLAEHLHARFVPVPERVARGAIAASWRLRLQRVDPGWLDLLLGSPFMATTRARGELGWSPTWSATAALDELLLGVTENCGGASAALRPRDPWQSTLTRLVHDGPIGARRLP